MAELAEKVLKGNVQAAARLITNIEDELPNISGELETIYQHTGKAYIVGLTGSPGVGKSTLVDSLITVLRKKNLTIGILAIDPTSPFSGGAILGDRIRMQQHGLDKDVFIRSLATRGWLGGLAKATIGMINVMDAMGKDIILVETVGAGQSEVDIAKVADTCIVVLSPASGDEMQMIKAGIMEIANIFAINKADKGGADNIKLGLELMLNMKTYKPNERKPKIVLTEAISGKGVEELVDDIFEHRDYLVSTGKLEECRRERAKIELISAMEGFTKSFVHQEIEKGGYLERLVDDLVQRRTNPHAAAVKVIEQFTEHFKANITSKGV